MSCFIVQVHEDLVLKRKIEDIVAYPFDTKLSLQLRFLLLSLVVLKLKFYLEHESTYFHAY